MKKLICLFVMSHLFFFAHPQTSSRVISYACACIVNIKDTELYHSQSTKPVIKSKVETGDRYNTVIQKLGYPQSKITGLMDNKEKWTYDTLFVYLKDQTVDLID